MAYHLKGDASVAGGMGYLAWRLTNTNIETRALLLQTHITHEEIVLAKKRVCDDPADPGTKHLDQATTRKHVRSLSFATRDGRSSRSKLSLRATLWRELLSLGMVATACLFLSHDVASVSSAGYLLEPNVWL